MANAKAFSSSGSDSSESSSSSLTTSTHRKTTTVVQQRRNSEAGNPRTLQSLVRTKCWSIAPLWKFVTYELETAPIKPREPKNQIPEKLSRSASFRPKKQHQKQNHQNHKTISYENDLNQMFKMVSSGPSGIPQRKTHWSKPHPQQSLNSNKRQPLQPSNRILVEQPPIVHLKEESEPIIEVPMVDPEYKPCGVLKKPGSYRSHHGLKKVAFLENTELNRSTL